MRPKQPQAGPGSVDTASNYVPPKVPRLIALEQPNRELHDRWLEAQDELLMLKLPKPPAH